MMLVIWGFEQCRISAADWHDGQCKVRGPNMALASGRRIDMSPRCRIDPWRMHPPRLQPRFFRSAFVI